MAEPAINKLLTDRRRECLLFLNGQESRIVSASSLAAHCELVYVDLVEQLRDLLAEFVDDEPCRLDHHGHCQEHMDFGPGECRQKRAKALLSRFESEWESNG